MIDSLVKDNKVSVVGIYDYDYAQNLPESMIVSRVEEVRRRIALPEERAANGEYLTEEEYEKQMDTFFEEELSIKR